MSKLLRGQEIRIKVYVLNEYVRVIQMEQTVNYLVDVKGLEEVFVEMSIVVLEGGP